MDDANRYLPEFMDDYNRRFGRSARNDHDAHRPLLERDDLDDIFTWQEERRVTAQLTVHHKRTMYLAASGRHPQRPGGMRQLAQRELLTGQRGSGCFTSTTRKSSIP